MGTDAGLDTQHGRNLHELAALIEAGVPADRALVAGTLGGARLLGRSDLGVIRPGAPADLVCFDADPTRPEVLRDPSHVVAVSPPEPGRSPLVSCLPISSCTAVRCAPVCA